MGEVMQITAKQVIEGQGFVMVAPDKQLLFIPAAWDVFHLVTGKLGPKCYPIGGRNIRNPNDYVADY